MREKYKHPLWEKYGDAAATNSFDARNARICKMTVEDGVITAHRSKDHI